MKGTAKFDPTKFARMAQAIEQIKEASLNIARRAGWTDAELAIVARSYPHCQIVEVEQHCILLWDNNSQYQPYVCVDRWQLKEDHPRLARSRAATKGPIAAGPALDLGLDPLPGAADTDDDVDFRYQLNKTRQELRRKYGNGK